MISLTGPLALARDRVLHLIDEPCRWLALTDPFREVQTRTVECDLSPVRLYMLYCRTCHRGGQEEDTLDTMRLLHDEKKEDWA
jgi:hypothetical protein